MVVHGMQWTHGGPLVVHGFGWYLAVAGGVLKLLQCGTTDVGIVYLCTWDILLTLCACGYSKHGIHSVIVWYLGVCVCVW